MEDEEAQRVKTILHLSETEVMNITHFQRGNGLISTNNNNITVEFKASKSGKGADYHRSAGASGNPCETEETGCVTFGSTDAALFI